MTWFGIPVPMAGLLMMPFMVARVMKARQILVDNQPING